MQLLWIFIALCPIAFAALIAFAAHIDPLSGHWRPLADAECFGSDSALAPHDAVIAYSE